MKQKSGTSDTRASSLLTGIIALCLAPTFASGAEAPATGVDTQYPSLETAIAAEVQGLAAELATHDEMLFWKTVGRLRSLLKDPVACDSALLCLDATTEERVELGLAAALASAGEYEVAVAELRRLVEAGRDNKVRSLAARILGGMPELYLGEIRTFGTGGFEESAGHSRKRSVLQCLTGVLDDPDVELQVAVADSILRMTGGLDERAGRTLIRIVSMADKFDPVTREAVLSLAENGLVDPVRDLLEELRVEPTEQGRRALAALSAERTVGSGMVKEVMRYISALHIDSAGIEADKLLTAGAKGMARSRDDYSDYLDQDDVKDMDALLTGHYSGIGAWVGIRDGLFTIVAPMYDGPAYKAGLRSMDRVLEVDGTETDKKTFLSTVRRLKGTAGTKVVVKILRRGWPEPKEIEIVRADIPIRGVRSEMLPDHVGHIRLERFGEGVSKQVERTVERLKGDGMRSLILDMRNNGGGLLDEAVAVSDLFLDTGKLIVYSEGRPKASPRHNFFSVGRRTLPGFPMIVLVNKGSASASEIVAGALSEWGRAVLGGETTFGKGSVQRIMPMLSTRNTTRLKLTVARYYLPSARCIDGVGVEPDVVVEHGEISAWEYDEFAGIEKRHPDCFAEFADRLIEKQREEFCGRLAEDDGGEWSAYPGFEEFYAGLETGLSRDRVRQAVRIEVRRKVADLRARMFISDLREDIQLRTCWEALAAIEPAAATGTGEAPPGDPYRYEDVLHSLQQAAAREDPPKPAAALVNNGEIGTAAKKEP